MAQVPPRFVTLDENPQIKTLIFSPNYEVATRIISKWTLDVEQIIAKNNRNYSKLSASRATRDELRRSLDENPIIFAMFYCHGEYDTIFGQNDMPVVGPANVGQLARTIVSTVSCRCGRDLADQGIRQGVYAWFGYDEIFSLWTLDDKSIDGFRESANTPNISVLSNKTTGQAYDDTIKEYNKWIDYYIDKPEDPMSFHYESTLIGDRDELVLKGDKNISTKSIE